MGEVGVAIVTGSNKGIGLAIVRGLCSQFKGDVFLTSRNPQLGRDAVAQLEAEGLTPKYHQLDITSMESIEALKKFMLEEYGGVDVLVNNAGIYKTVPKAPPIEQATVTTSVNFTGTLNMMRAFVPITKAHGRIVNVSSLLGTLSRLSSDNLRDRFSSPTLTEAELLSLMDEFASDVRDGKHIERGWPKPNSFYSSTKIGVTAMTKVFAREMAKSGKEDIIINACCPGWVKTDMTGDEAPLTPDQGAETPIICALLPPGSPNGEFWSNKAVAVW